MAKVHDFTERLAWSESLADEPFWNAAYRQFFPSMVNCMQASGDYPSQRMGVDRLVYLNNDRMVRVDEKKREKDYQDIALEFTHTIGKSHTSKPARNPQGWMEKNLVIDYIAYAFMPSKRVYFLDWLILRRTWNENKVAWKSKYFISTASNIRGSYFSHSVCVPIDILMKSMGESSSITVQMEVSAESKLA
jgi:hypothetical protein